MTEYANESEERSRWSGCDPFTLVAAVRDGVQEIPQNHRSGVETPLDELLSRFEQQSRAALGGSIVTAAGPLGSGASPSRSS